MDLTAGQDGSWLKSRLNLGIFITARHSQHGNRLIQVQTTARLPFFGPECGVCACAAGHMAQHGLFVAGQIPAYKFNGFALDTISLL